MLFPGRWKFVCARANGVSRSRCAASRCASDENGRYYIEVEPRLAAMALLLVTRELVGDDYYWYGLGRVQAGKQTGSDRQCETRSACRCHVEWTIVGAYVYTVRKWLHAKCSNIW